MPGGSGSTRAARSPTSWRSGSGARIAKVPSTPPDFERGVVDAIAAPGSTGRHRAPRARHDGGDERDDHEDRRADGAAHDRRLPRRARAAPPQPRRALRHPVGPAPAARAAPPPLRGARAHRLRRRRGRAARRGESVRAAVRARPRPGHPAFAVCFLHSYVNPAHEERRAGASCARSCPTRSSCHSAEILREPQEFERTSTTVVNAYLGPSSPATCRRLERPAAGGGLRRAVCRHALRRRPADRRQRGAIPGAPRDVGPGGGRHGRGGLGGGALPASGSRRPRSSSPQELARADGLDRSSARHRRHERRHRGGPRRPARAGDRVLARVRQPIRFPAIDLIDDRRRRRLDRLGRRGRLPHVGPAERRRGARPGGLRPRRRASPRSPTRTSCSGASPATVGLAGGLALDAGAARAGGRRFADALGPVDVEDAARHRRASPTPTWRAAIRVVTVERGPRSARVRARRRSAAPGRCTPPSWRARLEIPEVLVPAHPASRRRSGCCTSTSCTTSSSAHRRRSREPIATRSRPLRRARGAMRASARRRRRATGDASASSRGRPALRRPGAGPDDHAARAGRSRRSWPRRSARALPRGVRAAVPVRHGGHRGRGLGAARARPRPRAAARTSRPRGRRPSRAARARRVVHGAGPSPRGVGARRLPVGRRLAGPARVEQLDTTTGSRRAGPSRWTRAATCHDPAAPEAT